MPIKLLGAFASFFMGTYGHSNMVFPPTWTDRFAGNGELKSDMWFNNQTVITGAGTLPAEMKSYNQARFNGGTMAEHPWMKPGTAEREEGGYAPCGIAGGNPEGCPNGNPNGNNCPGGGYGFGQDAFEAGIMNGAPVTEWKAGESAEVGFRILANHGGGYSYRLCPVGTPETMTEACFQAGALDFDGDTSWIDFDNEGAETRIAFQNSRTTAGTPLKADGTPQQWSRNPVPACNSADGGLFQFGGANCDERGMCTCRSGTQFPAPAPGVEGYGTHILSLGTETFQWSVRDMVQVPADLPAGDYVLSFRWDCEQTAQSWATCSSIKVAAAEAGAPGAAPAGTPAATPAGTPAGTPAATPAAPAPVANANACDPVALEDAIRAGVMGPPLQFGLITPCTNMGEELNALQADPTKDINTDAICGCVTGFDEAFWAEPPKDCDLMPGVTFVALHQACSAGLDLNDVRPAPVPQPVPTPVTPPATNPVPQPVPTPVQPPAQQPPVTNPNECNQDELRAALTPEIINNRPNLIMPCNAMNQEFQRLLTQGGSPNLNTICNCVSGFDRQFFGQEAFQCDLQPGITWTNLWDTCQQVVPSTTTPPATNPNNGPVAPDGKGGASGNGPGIRESCDEAAIRQKMTTEIVTRRPQLVEPCTAMNNEFQRARDSRLNPNQGIICGCVGAFEQAWWAQPVFQCELAPDTQPGLNWLELYNRCAGLVSDGTVPSNRPATTPATTPGTTGTNPMFPANPAQNGPVVGGTGPTSTATPEESSEMATNMTPIYGGIGLVAAILVGLFFYKRSSKVSMEQNNLAYSNMSAPAAAQQTVV